VAIDITSQITRGGIDFQLWFATQVLRLQSLHYGYWDCPENVTLDLEAVRKAQVRYTDYLVSIIPPGLKTVLDVGCGVGCNARALAAKGYKVTAISPDANHQVFFDDLPADQVRFCRAKYEEFSTEQLFDLVLMSESQNYFDMTVGFEHAKRHLVPGGRLLVAGMFRRKDSKEFAAVQCIDKPYIEAAARHGFALKRSVDVTENVMGTIRMAERYLKPVIRVAQTYFDTGFFLKRWLASFLIAKRAMSPKRLCEYYGQYISPEFYRTHVKYQWLLFERDK